MQVSDWECRVEPDGRVRLGLMYVNGLREAIGRAIAAGVRAAPTRPTAAMAAAAPWRRAPEPKRCPKCGCDDESMLEDTPEQTLLLQHLRARVGRSDRRPGAMRAPAAARRRIPVADPSRASRYRSIEALIAATGVRRDELATLAEIGALNAFGHHRRSALWQIERAVRPSGELFTEDEEPAVPVVRIPTDARRPRPSPAPPIPEPDRRPRIAPRSPPSGPLRPMTPPERLMADYAGTSLTIGPHPLALRRAELALRGVLRARDLPQGRHGRRVRVAGAVITRQRPGTAKGFVFLTLEDETGIANIIVRPDLFAEQRSAIIGAPYLLIEGTLQLQEGVTSIKAERVLPLAGEAPEPQSHDFR